MTRKTRVVLAIVGLLVIGFSGFLYVSRRLHVNPFLLCLTPLPSEATVVDAIRSGPGDGSPGVGNDGREYDVHPRECPHAVGSGTPNLTLWLRIAENGTLIDEGVLSVGIIESDRVVLFGFQSKTRKTGSLRTVGQ
jgi:hypothetical protein